MTCVDFRQPALCRGDFNQYKQQSSNFANPGLMKPSDLAVSEELYNHFKDIQDRCGGAVTPYGLQQMAEGPAYDAFDHHMKELAHRLLQRPELLKSMDGAQHGGRTDGFISRDDVGLTIDRLRDQESQRMSRFPGQQNGYMSQMRLDSNYAPSVDWRQPAYGANTPAPAPRFAGVGQFNGPMNGSGERPYSNHTDQSLVDKLHAQFSTFEDPANPGNITDRSLAMVAGGVRPDGSAALPEEVALAMELRERGGLFKVMDKDATGKYDGAVSRDDLETASYRLMNDHELTQVINNNFRKFTEGANDKYVSEDELKAAANSAPSDTKYTSEAREAAKELLNRPGLLRAIDIGIKKESGKPGAEDRRFDQDNLNHVLEKTRAPAA